MKSDLAVSGADLLVAPHWGAWIEIQGCGEHPLGLPGRTPLGCVD